MKKRVNIYLREKTFNLLKDYMEIEGFDMSTTIDILLAGRLEYLNQAKEKGRNQVKKENKSYMEKNQEEYWNKLRSEFPDKTDEELKAISEERVKQAQSVIEELRKKWR